MRNKSSSLEPGYVWATYVPLATSEVIDEYGSKSIKRKKKITKIFDLGLDIKDDTFSPKQSISSRYSKKVVNSKYYKTIKMQ